MQALGLCWGETAPAAIFTETRFVEYPEHRGARLLFDVWRARPYFQVGRHLPSRTLARLLSGLALYEPSPEDFRVRLAGHGLRRHFGRDVTGTRLAALAELPHAGRHSGAVAALLERGRPLLLQAGTEDGRDGFELVALRVLAPDSRTQWIMGGIFYKDWRL